MKNYILTHRTSGKQHQVTDEQLNKLKATVPVARTYTIEAVPEKKSVPKPAELEQETPDPVKKGVKKTEKNE